MRKHFTVDEIFETATSDEGMTKKEAAKFHAFNPNGVVKQMPTDFSLPGNKWARGVEIIGGQHDNYHAKKIVEYATGKRFRRWDLDHAVKHAREDGDRAKDMLAEKRNRVNS